MRIIAIILLCCGFANATALDENTIFDGDVYGTYNNLRLRVTVSSDTTTTTTVVSYSGADITDINASNITTGILSNYRLDATSVTLQGNIFNVSDRLLKILTSGYIWNDLIDSGTWISTNTALGGDLSGYLPNPQVVDDSHNHSIATLFGVVSATTPVWEILESSTTLGHNVGLITAIDISDNGDGTVALSSCTAILRDNSDKWGRLYYVYIPAQNLTLSEGINFIAIEWNSGSPIYTASTDSNYPNQSDILAVMRAYMMSGALLYSKSYGNTGRDALANTVEKEVRINNIERESGLVLSEEATRIVLISAGKTWFGVDRNSLDAVRSDVADTHLWTHSGGVWTQTHVTQYPNTWYDDGTSTVTLSANRYAVINVYRGIFDGEIDFTLGTGDYTISQALASTVPTPPPFIPYFYFFVGRIIVQNGSDVAYAIQNVATTEFTYAGVSSHTDLLNLGNDDHLQYLLLAGRGGQSIDDNIHVNGSFASSTSVTSPMYCISDSCITSWYESQNYDLADSTGSLAWEKITYPSDCASGEYVYGANTSGWLCSTPASSGSGGGNTYTDIGVVGQVPYYVATDSIAASGIQPSQILTSTNTTVARTSAQNTFSVAVDGGATQTFYNTSTNAAASMGHYIQNDTAYSFFRAFAPTSSYSGGSAWEANGSLYIGTNNGSGGRLSIFTNDNFYGTPRLVFEAGGAATFLSSATFNNGALANTITTTSTATLAAVSVSGAANFTSQISTTQFVNANISNILTSSRVVVGTEIDVGWVARSSHCFVGDGTCIASCPTGTRAISCDYFWAGGAKQPPAQLYNRIVDCYSAMFDGTSEWYVFAQCVKFKY